MRISHNVVEGWRRPRLNWQRYSRCAFLHDKTVTITSTVVVPHTEGEKVRISHGVVEKI